MPREFNPNAFWYTLTGNYQYDVSRSKGTIIRVPQRVLTSGLFAREDNLNVPHLSELYFLHSTLEGTRIDPRSFCTNQLLSAVTSSAKRIVIGGLTILSLGWLVLSLTLMI